MDVSGVILPADQRTAEQPVRWLRLYPDGIRIEPGLDLTG